MSEFTEVGTTTPGIWDQISNQGFLDDYPDAKFDITEPNHRFPELSKGTISVRTEDSRRFLRLKEHMKEQNGGSWIIE